MGKIESYFRRSTLFPYTTLFRSAIKKEIPIWEKSNLTLEEASAYFSIGINKLRELTNDKNCKYVIWCGNKRLIIRKRISKRM